MTYTEFRSMYNYSLKQYPDVAYLFGYWNTLEIEITTTRQEKQGKTWKTTETDTDTVSVESYMNTIDSMPFFRAIGGHERATVCYTPYGKIPTELKSISPDRQQRIIREFKF